MLSAQEKQEIEEELKNHEYKHGACIDALKIVQRHRGWVTDEGLQDVAEELEMSVEELDHVATFYNLIYRKPVGRHVILICDSISCWIMGYEAVRERICRRLEVNLGETTPDGRFTVLPIVCLGTCDHAPALMIDEDLYRDLDDEKIDSILEKYS